METIRNRYGERADRALDTDRTPCLNTMLQQQQQQQQPQRKTTPKGVGRRGTCRVFLACVWAMTVVGYSMRFLDAQSSDAVKEWAEYSQLTLDHVESSVRTFVEPGDDDRNHHHHHAIQRGETPPAAGKEKVPRPRHPLPLVPDFPGRDPDRQRIVIMPGPHKAASTTLQSFLWKVTGRTTWILPRNEPKDEKRTPIPAFSGWAWPVGTRREFGRDPKTSLTGGGFTDMPPPKFHAPLASLVTGKAYKTFLYRYEFDAATPDANRAYLGRVSAYFRKLFAVPWKEGKNLVVGSEELTGLVMALGGEFPNLHPPIDEWAPVAIDGNGESRHVDPHSSGMIDRLLRVLPWNTTCPGSTLELRDIEVHVNYRTPRIDHAVSVWHQIHNGTTLREFFATNAKELYVMNSLALALQFVRKGLRTTIVDMTGAKAHGKKIDGLLSLADGDENGDNADEKDEDGNTMTIIGGQEGILACDILRIGTESETAGLPPGRGGPGGKNRGFCDERSRLHLAGYRTAPLDHNRKSDPQPRDLSEDELRRMDDLLRAYDCGVWRNLARYREKGLLRVLYPSDDDDHLIRDCYYGTDGGGGNTEDGNNDESASEFSFAAVLREFRRMSLAERVVDGREDLA